MSSVPNPRLYLRQSVQPNSFPVPGENLAYDDSQTIDIEATSSNLAPGSFLVKVEAISIDPYFRGRMRPPTVQSYSPPFDVGEPIQGHLVGSIVKSASEKYKEGSKITAIGPYQRYSIISEESRDLFILPDIDVPVTSFIGVLGMPGMTAFSGWREYSHAKPGETLFVTTGAGAVGSLIIQLAKLDGLKVIASVGSDDKIEYCKQIGADAAFNYKTTDANEALKQFGNIDIYWDHVGGVQLDAALANMNDFGRIIVCGQAASYSSEPVPIKNFANILVNRLTVKGHLVFDISGKYKDSFHQTIAPKVQNGDIKFKESVYKGWENAPQALDDLLKGKNSGKVVVLF